jgi:hypothetical protein
MPFPFYMSVTEERGHTDSKQGSAAALVVESTSVRIKS